MSSTGELEAFGCVSDIYRYRCEISKVTAGFSVIPAMYVTIYYCDIYKANSKEAIS